MELPWNTRELSGTLGKIALEPIRIRWNLMEPHGMSLEADGNILDKHADLRGNSW